MRTYPINLVGLDQRRCVVIGGGAVAARKVAGLLDAGAHVTVVSPRPAPELLARAQSGAIRLVQRPYEPSEVDGAFLVVAATDDPEVNRAIAGRVQERGGLVNVVDDPTASTFIVPAVARRGDLTIAVSTGGANPALAARLRNRLAAHVGVEYGDLADLLAELRPQLLAHGAVDRLLDADLLEVLRRHGPAAGRQRAFELIAGLEHNVEARIEPAREEDCDETDT
jgi:siroheme synthase-like protein